MPTEPLRPTTLETVFYEPDQRAVIAVLPGALWLAPGDIVELDDPPPRRPRAVRPAATAG